MYTIVGTHIAYFNYTYSCRTTTIRKLGMNIAWKKFLIRIISTEDNVAIYVRSKIGVTATIKMRSRP